MIKKRKCLGFIYNAKTSANVKIGLRHLLTNDFHHINNIASCFEEIYILNMSNFDFSGKKEIGFEKVFKEIKFDKKIKFCNPKNIKELSFFLKDKSFHAIITLGKTFFDLPIHFLLRIYNVKFFQISNVGNRNYTDIPSRKNFLKGYFNIKWRVFMHKFFIILKLFGVIPKIEIRFISNKVWVKNSNKKKTFYSKFIRFFKISYARKLMIINSRAYDLFHKNNFIKNEDYIVLLDEIFNNYQYLRLGTYTSKKKKKIHYKNLIEKLKIISKYYKKKVVICIHPGDNLQEKKKIFSGYVVKQYQTKRFIYQSKLVLFFESSAIIDAIMLKKKIITIDSKALDLNQRKHNKHYVNEIGVPLLDIDENLTFDQKTINKFKYETIKINKTYNSYIKKYIAPDTSKISGYKKIAYVLKKEYLI